MTISSSDFYKTPGFHSSTKLYQADCLEGKDSNGGFFVTISKEDQGWVIYTEEHEPKDISILLDTPIAFKTKKEAIKTAIEFAEYFYTCWIDNN